MSKKVFIIQNHLHQYLGKQSNWLSGKDAQSLYRSDFHDEALNTLIELNAKDISLRGVILEVDIDLKKRPVIDVSEEALEIEQQEFEAKQKVAAED